MLKKTVSGTMLTLLLTSVFGFAFGIQTAKTEPTTIIVPDDYPTIQQAINAANENDTVFVRNGTYYENVVVNKTVTLVGEDRTATVLDGGGTGTGILVTADHATVENFSVQNWEVGIKVESNDNVISSNLVSSNGYDEAELLTDQEIYQEYVSPTHRWYLHNLVNSSYTAFFNITEHTPAISVQALGHEDVNQLGIGLFHDENGDHEPQLQEYVGYMDAKEQYVHVFLVNPPVGQYIIKVLGWEVPGEPGHFDLEITRYTGYGIVFLSSRKNIITENLVTHNPVGLYLHDSYNTTIQLNDAIENVGGIVLSDSTECVVSNNNASLNEFGSAIRQFGIGLTFWSVHDFYISENNVSSNTFGIWLFNSSDNEVIGNGLVSNTAWGLVLYASHDNTVHYNNIITSGDGIRMMFSCQNNFTENHFESNGHAGIFLWLDNNNNSITRNKFYSNGQHGVELKFSNNNTISRNEIAFSSSNGILIIESTGCIVKDNYVFSNSKGIMFYDAFGNMIYHNSILDSWDQQGADVRSTNFWDAEYPLGGNYWSDHTEIDEYRGLNQNEPGSDGISDTAYNVEESQDNYPLTKPYAGPHDIGLRLPISKTVVGEGYNTTVTIDAIIINYGEQTEIFNFTFQMNTTIHKQPLTLTSRNSTTLTFELDTTGVPKCNYTITANVTVIQGETDIADNKVDDTVLVSTPGDVNGDRKVDVFDAVITINAVPSVPWWPNWNPNADIDCNGKVDVFDAVICIGNIPSIW